MHHGFAYGAGYTLTPAPPPAGLSYLPASPHRSPTTRQDPTDTPGRRLRRDPDPPGTAVSTADTGVGRSHAGTGISTRYPSTTPLGLALGPDSPRAEQPGPGTLGHPAEGILTLHALLMPAFSLAPPPRVGHPPASPVARRSPTHPHPCTTPHQEGQRRTRADATASAVCLSPATLSARNHLTSELLRTLSRMAASKPTSWLSLRPHILFHLAHA
jgi:hypothetical protein